MKVLYVLGRGRSGSTILGNVLGAIPGFFSAGELRVLWDPVVVQQSPCGCGTSIAECPIWSDVLQRLSDIDLDQVVRWQHDIVKESNTFRLLRCQAGCSWPALEGYARVTARLYDAIQEISGCAVVVDTSKRPSYGAFINMLERCDPYFVHLARDPRASAYSWQARRHRSAHGDEVRRRNAFDSTVRWDLLNAGSEIVLRGVPKHHRIQLRYEDFVTKPLDHTRRICELVGETDRRLPFVDEHTVDLGLNHTIAGNPSRFTTGRVELRDTREWRTKQDVWSRWIATAVALPFLRRYGYAFRG